MECLKLATCKGAARQLEVKPDVKIAAKAWFGYGYSDKAYPLERAGAMIEWASKRFGHMLVVVPDQIEIINLVARKNPEYARVGFMDNSPFKLNGEVSRAGFERKEQIGKQIKKIGVGNANVATISEIAHNMGRELDSILGILWNIRGGFPRDLWKLVFEKGHDMEMGENLASVSKEKKNMGKWLVEYPLREIAFTIWLAKSRGYTFKIGPIGEAAYDKMTLALLNGDYGFDCAGYFGIDTEKIGMAYLESA